MGAVHGWGWEWSICDLEERKRQEGHFVVLERRAGEGVISCRCYFRGGEQGLEEGGGMGENEREGGNLAS